MLNTEKNPIDFKRTVITVNQLKTAIRQFSSNFTAEEITKNKSWDSLG